MPPKKKNTAEADKAAKDSTGDEKKGKKTTRSEEEASPPKLARAESTVLNEEAILRDTVPFVRLTKDSDFNSKSMTKIITWNVAGLRSVLKKSTELQDLLEKEKPDFLCLQEARLNEAGGDVGVVKGYSFVDCIGQRKGYAGTRTYIRDGITAKTTGRSLEGGDKVDTEGRIIITDAGDFYIANTYVPNAGMTLDNLQYRVTQWDPKMLKCLETLQQSKPVVWTGDLNVAERDYDRFFTGTFKQMQKSPGFTPEERQSFRAMTGKANMVDGFRHLYPTAHKTYTFWSMRFSQRAKNNGWRLDYFVISQALVKKVVDVYTLPQYTASDHCPVVCWLKK